jgi:hypothetical protein
VTTFTTFIPTAVTKQTIIICLKKMYPNVHIYICICIKNRVGYIHSITCEESFTRPIDYLEEVVSCKIEVDKYAGLPTCDMEDIIQHIEKVKKKKKLVVVIYVYCFHVAAHLNNPPHKFFY